MRRIKVQGLPKTHQFNASRWAGKHHQHGCRQCHIAYSCACQTPETDDRCSDCQQGRRTFIQRDRYPRECCNNRKLVTHRDIRERFLLAGPGPWWVCPTCCRQFTTSGSTS